MIALQFPKSLPKRKDLKVIVLDAASSVIFWTPILAAWSFGVVHVTVEQLLGIMAGSVVLNMAFGGPYGKFINKWRSTLKKYYGSN